MAVRAVLSSLVLLLVPLPLLLLLLLLLLASPKRDLFNSGCWVLFSNAAAAKRLKSMSLRQFLLLLLFL